MPPQRSQRCARTHNAEKTAIFSQCAAPGGGSQCRSALARLRRVSQAPWDDELSNGTRHCARTIGGGAVSGNPEGFGTSGNVTGCPCDMFFQMLRCCWQCWRTDPGRRAGQEIAEAAAPAGSAPPACQVGLPGSYQTFQRTPARSVCSCVSPMLRREDEPVLPTPLMAVL